jgi:anti-sigma regulatory factor (Ser/Thr protein kinase)
VPIRTRVLPSLPEASIEARRFVRETAAGDVQPQVLDDALLLTSELVTNAVRHAGHAIEDPIEVEVSVDDEALRVTVRDKGPGFDPARPREQGEEGGLGYHLVKAISSRWGVERTAVGTHVWFEIGERTAGPGT